MSEIRPSLAAWLLMACATAQPAWSAAEHMLAPAGSANPSMALGLVFGAFSLLITACLGQWWVYRDAGYLGYGMYGLLAGLGLLAYSDTTAQLPWPDLGWWGETAPGVFALLATAAACTTTRTVSDVAIASRRLSQVLAAVAIVAVLLAALLPALPLQQALPLLGTYVSLAVVAMLATSGLAWHSGNAAGPWLVAAQLSLLMAALLTALKANGWIESTGIVPTAAWCALALEVPLSWVALNVRSRERHGARIRNQDPGSHDPLTGLMSAGHFHYRVRQVVAHFKRYQTPNVAVVYFELSSYQRIHDTLGEEAAEQSLLRSAKVLRAMTREYDTVSRIGVSRFGIILEGDLTRAAVSAIAVRVIAAGQMTEPKKSRTPVLYFHGAAALLGEVLLDAPQLDAELSKILTGMGRHNALPLRFVKPRGTTATATAEVPPASLRRAQDPVT